MIKLTLKRRISGRAIKKAIRESEKTDHWSDRRKYWKNNPSGRKYQKAMYELTGKESYWAVEGFIKKYKKERKKGKLKKLYKQFPEHSPAYKAKKEHEERHKAWLQKIKLNELCQNSNSK